MGGKHRICKPLAAAINAELDIHAAYVEPFVGAAYVYQHVRWHRKIAMDANEYLIALYQSDPAGLPDDVSEEEYKSIKDNNKQGYNPALVAFVGFGCSFGGKWFGGYARGENRNYAKTAKNAIIKKVDNIKTHSESNTFISAKMEDATWCDSIPDYSFVYCDPPYKGTTQYRDTFDYALFIKKIESLKGRGCTVWVSEYAHNVPPCKNIVLEINSPKSLRDAQGLRAATKEIVYEV